MTAQEQLNAFLEHCKNLRIGKRFSFKQGSSSLRDFIEKLEKQIKDNQFRSIDEGTLVELKRTSPKDHVKYLPAIKSLAAVWATSNRYIRAGGIDVHWTLYWDRVTGNLGNVPTKIGISSPSNDYPVRVAKHLTALDHTDAGRTLLTELAVNPVHSVTIVDHPIKNQCTSSDQAMNNVTKELYPDNVSKLGIETRRALSRKPIAGTTPAGWLANQINHTPEYVLKGVPAVAPCDLDVTEAEVEAWINDRDISQDFEDVEERSQIKNAIIIALYSQSVAGTGCGSTVHYTLGDINPLNAERPPAIGLAHELVHAYYNMRGEQPGRDVDHPTTVLFEYRCVGLGPWSNAAVSENAIRNDWAAALLHFDQDDTRNRQAAPRRDFYSAP